jgi:phage terminase large subunit-like protein
MKSWKIKEQQQKGGEKRLNFWALALTDIKKIDYVNNSWGVFKNQLYFWERRAAFVELGNPKMIDH